MSDDAAVGDVARRPDRPAAGGPVRHRPATELERGRQAGRLRAARRPGVAGELARPRPGRARARPSWRRTRTSSATSIALRPPPPVPSTSAMSSAAESPPGPRRASRSRGRSAAGRSRTDRVAPAVAEERRRPGRPRSPCATPARAAWRAWAGARRRAATSARRPRARTTEARRFPPPSGPGNTTEPTDGPYRRLTGRFVAATCTGRRPRYCASAPRREEREQHLDRR